MNLQEWKQEYKSIRHKIFNIDKDLGKQLQMNKSSTSKNDISSIMKVTEKSDFDREKERDQIFKQIKFLKQENEKFKDKLKNFEKTPQYLQKVQLMSESLEQKMSEFKIQQMEIFDQIAEEEEQLENELELFNERLPYYENSKFENIEKKKGIFQICEEVESDADEEASYQSNQQTKRKHFADKENDSQSGNLEETIEDIDQELEHLKQKIDVIDKKIVQNGGKNQGWTNQDQQDFLKIRVRHKNQITKQAFLNDCLSILGMFDEQQIRDHIDKFQKYLQFEEDKKNLMQTYKDLKEKRKEIQLEQIRKEEANQNQKKQFEEQLKKQATIQREKQKEEILQWKLKKQAKEEIKSENAKMMQDEEQRERERIKRAQLEEQKRLVEEYKQIKEVEKMRQKEREEYEKSISKRLITTGDKERIRQKEEEMIKKKQEIARKQQLLKEENQVKKQKHDELKQTKYAYVPSKLNEKTTASKMKEGEKVETGKIDRFGSCAQTFGGAPVKFTGRAVPSWRNGV
ncbi:hypothetical protein ABPG74_021215 [Tetrahymena malaccensis]